jgi:uncharacterized protein YdeI (YjbR/CyaY-like superfamily)
MDNSLYFEDRKEWRSWLKKNYDKESHIWLSVDKKGSVKKGIPIEEAVEEAICFGWIDGQLKSVDSEKLIIRFSPRKKNSVWSKINKERAEKLIALGIMTPAGLDKIEAALMEQRRMTHGKEE